MSKTPMVKPLSKAAVAGRLGAIFMFFKNISFKMAQILSSGAAEAKDGLSNRPSQGRND